MGRSAVREGEGEGILLFCYILNIKKFCIYIYVCVHNYILILLSIRINIYKS